MNMDNKNDMGGKSIMASDGANYTACPVCGSTDIYYDNIEIDCDEANQECVCEECGSYWYVVYKFHRIDIGGDGRFVPDYMKK